MGFLIGELFLICRIALFWNSFATVETYLLPIYGVILLLLGFPCGLAGKESACKVGDLGSIPGLGRSMEKGKATHSCILAWRIHGLYSPWGRKESDMTE